MADVQVVAEMLKMSIDDPIFNNMRLAHDAGDDSKFTTMVSAATVLFSKDEDAVKKGFDEALKLFRIKNRIEDYQKRARGFTMTAALLTILAEGFEIAKDGDAKVSFVIETEMVKDEDGGEETLKAFLVPRFHGVDGTSSGSNGSGTGRRGRYIYKDGGKTVDKNLKKYILEVYPKSQAAGIINDYATRENSNISAWSAVQRDDTLSKRITREEKAAA